MQDTAQPRRPVLIVEDEALTAVVIAQVVRAAGYQVVGPAERMADAVGLAGTRPLGAAVLNVR